MKNATFGDIFSLSTSQGIVLLQFIHVDADGIEYVGVFHDRFRTQPINLEVSTLPKDSVAFVVGYMINNAYRRGLVELVAHTKVIFDMPTHMRTEHFVRGKMLGWHVVELSTMNRRLVTNLSASEKKLSPQEIWNPAMLKERIESGWSLDTWV